MRRNPLVMRRLQQILGDDASLAPLAARRQHELAVEHSVKRTLPPMLAAHVLVVDAHSAELVLATQSGAAAALLRQRAPSLARLLAHEGWEFTGIRVCVQARSAPRDVEIMPPKQIDMDVAGNLRRVAATLGEGALAAALRRLARCAVDTGSGAADEALQGVGNQNCQQ